MFEEILKVFLIVEVSLNHESLTVEVNSCDLLRNYIALRQRKLDSVHVRFYTENFVSYYYMKIFVFHRKINENKRHEL